jgi:hypothetical protein
MDYDPDEDDYQHVPAARRPGAAGGDSPSSYDPAPPGANPFADGNRYNAPPAAHTPPMAGRPSIDAYGAFSDPAPSGFSPAPASPPPRFDRGGGPPMIPEQNLGPPIGMSRTMQYADPYAAVRASIAGQPAQEPAGYDSGYQGYR